MTEVHLLNQGWNADPNVPAPKLHVEGTGLLLSFLMSSNLYPAFSMRDETFECDAQHWLLTVNGRQVYSAVP